MEENKIVIYQTEDGQTQIDVRLENVSLHVGNVFKEGELNKEQQSRNGTICTPLLK